jgi:RNA polymerase sigma factor (sigma-70 family)
MKTDIQQEKKGEKPSREASTETVFIQSLLDRLQAGDDSAREELINCACARLERLTRKMLRDWDRVHRWEDTSDVLQNALMRLYRSLAETRPARAVDFFRLAALNIRRELYDLARHYYGPRGEGANHITVTWKLRTDGELDAAMEQQYADGDDDPENLAAWAEFHEQVGRLPEEERELFDLLWYQELSQSEAAALLAISERTVKRRWASARLRLFQTLGGALPDSDGAVLG